MIRSLIEIPSLLPKNNPIASFKSQRLFLCHSTSNKEENFLSLLENCEDIASLRKLHACILTHGLSQNTFLGSKLITCYPKFGFLAESRWVFDRIIDNNFLFWVSILSGYYRNGQYSEVLRRYLDLKRKRIGFDSSVISLILKSCVEMAYLEFGKGVHVDAFKLGLSKGGFVGSSLIGLYAKFGDMVDASKVFDEITERDVVVYTSMITGYAQVGGQLAYEAFEFAHLMQEEEMDLNEVTMVSLLQAAAELEALGVGRSTHGYAIRRGIGCFNEVFETSLMDMYMKCRVPTVAALIFDRMKRRTVATWNALINGYLRSEQPLEALEYFCTMVQEKIIPSLFTFANVITCCADLRYLREGNSIHGCLVRMGCQLNIVAINALVDMYSKCNNMIQARYLFDVMEERDVIAYNTMMHGYVQNRFASEAVNMFSEMVGIGIKPNLGSILIVVSALSRLNNIRVGRSVHGYILRHKFDIYNTEAANQILYLYARCGCTAARRIFDWIRNKNLISWSIMMMGYCLHGHADETIKLFRMMQRERLDHDSVILIILMRASLQLGHLSLVREVHCQLYRALVESQTRVINTLIIIYAKLGKFNLVRILFEHTNRGCLISWNTMMAAYGMHGNCMEVLRLFDQMKQEMIEPDEITFTIILAACSHSGLLEEGLQVFHCMMEEYCITPTEKHFACIVDLLSRAGCLEEAYDLLKLQPGNATAMGALFAACKMHGNIEMGEVIGNCLLDLDSENPGVYTSVSNFYAEMGNWGEVVTIRDMAKKKGLKVSPGYSLIELNQRTL